jgi:hypothetical protein
MKQVTVFQSCVLALDTCFLREKGASPAYKPETLLFLGVTYPLFLLSSQSFVYFFCYNACSLGVWMYPVRKQIAFSYRWGM